MATIIPPAFETHPESTKIHCNACVAYYGISEKWIAPKSRNPHLNSQQHHAAINAQNLTEKTIADIGRQNHLVALTFQEQSSAVLREPPVLQATNTLDTQTSHSGFLEDPYRDMFEELMDNMDGLEFSAGDNDHGRSTVENLSQQITDFGIWDDIGLSRELGFGTDSRRPPAELIPSVEDETLTNVMQEMSINGQLNADQILGQEEPAVYNNSELLDKSSRWFPYPTKTMFILDTLDSLPRMRISDSLMKIILWGMNECGANEVPSFAALRRMQEKLRKQVPVPTRMFKSVLGNIFWVNDLVHLVGKDFSNPLTRKHLHLYPEEPPDGVVTEVWHCEKWHKGVDWSYLTPMVDIGNRHFYVDEFCSTKDGRIIIPKRWVRRQGLLCADAYLCRRQGNDLEVDDSHVENIAETDLSQNYPDLVNAGIDFSCSQDVHTTKMPNPLREKAAGDPLYTILIDKWHDDVSGNVSKSYNLHYNTYIAVRNLPRRLLQQEFNVHFICTSLHAGPSEQAIAIKELVEETHTAPAQTYDSLTKSTCKFRIFNHSGPSDNPMQSEECAHIGSNGNFSCRICHVGGTTAEKETDNGFHALFFPGRLRSAAESAACLDNQFKLASCGIAARVVEAQTATGTKDKLAQKTIDKLLSRARELRAQHPMKSVEEISDLLMKWVQENKETLRNPSLSTPGYDPHLDTPIELLHTILLGIVKYVWHSTHTSWKDDQKNLFSLRLQATDVSGLTIAPIRASYIMNYANSLIGRQFKTVVQTLAFHVYDLVSPLQYDLIKAVGELTSLLWVTTIRDMEQYVTDLDLAVANVLDLFALNDPSKIGAKIKLHLLAHAKAHVIRFGPLVGSSTEIMECFNSIFRACSILSNHQAPSRDIAIQLAGLESAKQRLTGGWWKAADGTWVQASAHVQAHLVQHPIIQSHLGWSEHRPVVPGTVTAVPAARRRQSKWSQTAAFKATNKPARLTDSTWTYCGSVSAVSGDICKDGSWVFAKIDSGTVVGKIVEILSGPNQEVFTVIESFQVCPTRHETFGMPSLTRRFGEVEYLVIKAKNILFNINVQHDCKEAKCAATGKKQQQQERQDSGVEIAVIEHQPLARYVINTHALHNADLLRDTLPRNLVQPIPYVENRRKTHDELATKLRESQNKRRADTRIKAAAGRAKKKAEAAAAQGARIAAAPAGATEQARGGEAEAEAELIFVDASWEEQIMPEAGASGPRAGKRRRVQPN